MRVFLGSSPKALGRRSIPSQTNYIFESDSVPMWRRFLLSIKSYWRATIHKSSSTCTVATTVDEHVRIAVGDAEYLLVPCCKNFLGTFNCDKDTLTPLVIFPAWSKAPISGAALLRWYNEVLMRDDIFQPQFLQIIAVYGVSQHHLKLQGDAEDVLKSWGTKMIAAVPGDAAELPGSGGPYVFGRGKTWQVWRIYYDYNNTLMVSFKPKSAVPNRQFEELDSALTANQLQVAVPSRCYHKKTSCQPLAGDRIVVKDSIDIQGFRNSLCNRAWLQLYPPAEVTANFVDRLVKLGAVLVGKTKLNALIAREETMECVEFLAPFNPRGDGYQTSSGSSSGSCAALGSYSWLDYAIGSDINGSCRKPAHWNGCFAMRPTTGSVDTTGMVGFWPRFNVPAFFGRDITKFQHLALQFYDDASKRLQTPKLSTNPQLAKAVILPSDYVSALPEAQRTLILSFAEAVARAIGTNVISMSLNEAWQNDKDNKNNQEPLDEYLKLAGTVPYYYDAYRRFEKFQSLYENKFGKAPFVHRAVRWRWEVISNVSQSERDGLYERLEIYKSWLLSKIFRVDNAQESPVVLVLPIENGKPNYRDEPPPPFELLNGFSPLNLSPIAGAPEVTAFAGEIEYESRISNRTEPMPIGVSLVGPPGSDFMVIDLCEKALKTAGLPLILSTGRSIFGEKVEFKPIGSASEEHSIESKEKRGERGVSGQS